MATDIKAACCGPDGNPDFKKMKSFIETCGKWRFSEDELAEMHEMCEGKSALDSAMMKNFMESCGCKLQ